MSGWRKTVKSRNEKGGAVSGKSVVTSVAIKKMLEARAGIAPLDKITGMAFGDGAVADGVVGIPDPDVPFLKHEIHRQVIDGFQLISDSCIRYTCTLAKEALPEKMINEIALYDEAGDIVAIKTFLSKGKDSDVEMVFDVDDTFWKEG